MLLTFTLLSELRNQKSAYKEYLAILPATFSTPLHYSIPELELLKGSPALDLVLALHKNIIKQYIYLHKLLKKPEVSKAAGFTSSNFAWVDWLWAVSAVMTRQNRVPVDSSFVLALIPLWDCLNHSDGAEITTMHDVSTATTEYSAMQAFGAGQQVTMFYGKRTNSDFLLNSGFVPDRNANDYMLISVRKNPHLLAPSFCGIYIYIYIYIYELRTLFLLFLVASFLIIVIISVAMPLVLTTMLRVADEQPSPTA